MRYQEPTWCARNGGAVDGRPRWGLSGSPGSGRRRTDRGPPGCGHRVERRRRVPLSHRPGVRPADGGRRRTGPEEWAIYVVFGTPGSDRSVTTRSGKMIRFLLAGPGFWRPSSRRWSSSAALVNTKAFRPRPGGARAQDRGSPLLRRAEVTFFPRPRVVIRSVVLDVPGLRPNGQILADGAGVDPLLRGNVRNGNFLLEEPELRVRIPGVDAGKAFSVEEFEGTLSSSSPRCEGGRPRRSSRCGTGARTLGGRRTDRVLRELDARLGFPPERMTLQVHCTSRFWRGFRSSRACTRRASRGHPCGDDGFRIRDFVERLPRAPSPGSGRRSFPCAERSNRRSAQRESGFDGGVPVLTLRRGPGAGRFG